MTWHNEFTETLQADWVESVYTIAYSKPWVEAISYWDFNRKGMTPSSPPNHRGEAERKLSPSAVFVS
jgi:hypothetical protein